MARIEDQIDDVRKRPICGVAKVAKLTGLMLEKNERCCRMLRDEI